MNESIPTTGNTRVAIDALSAVYGIECVSNVCVNLLLIVVIARTKTLQTQENLFFTHLLCWDAVGGAIGVVALYVWRELPAWCSLTCGFFRTSVGGSFVGLGLTMTEKYAKICHPFRSVRIFSRRNCILMLVASNVGMVCLFIGPLALHTEGRVFERVCACPLTGRSAMRTPAVVFMVAVFLANVAMGYLILREARRQKTRIAAVRQAFAAEGEDSRQKQHFSRAKFISLLSMFTFLGFVPTFTITMTGYMSGALTGNEELDLAIHLAATIIASANSLLDPVVFLIISPMLKRTLLQCCER